MNVTEIRVHLLRALALLLTLAGIAATADLRAVPQPARPRSADHRLPWSARSRSNCLEFGCLRRRRSRSADHRFLWIGIGGTIAHPPLPHHRTYGSVYGGSNQLSF